LWVLCDLCVRRGAFRLMDVALLGTGAYHRHIHKTECRSGSAGNWHRELGCRKRLPELVLRRWGGC